MDLVVGKTRRGTTLEVSMGSSLVGPAGIGEASRFMPWRRIAWLVSALCRLILICVFLHAIAQNAKCGVRVAWAAGVAIWRSAIMVRCTLMPDT